MIWLGGLGHPARRVYIYIAPPHKRHVRGTRRPTFPSGFRGLSPSPILHVTPRIVVELPAHLQHKLLQPPVIHVERFTCLGLVDSLRLKQRKHHSDLFLAGHPPVRLYRLRLPFRQRGIEFLNPRDHLVRTLSRDVLDELVEREIPDDEVRT